MAQVLKVLVVDDDPDALDLTDLALRQVGLEHERVLVDNGAQALDYLFGHGKWEGRDPSSCPDLALIDMKMPGINGVEVAREIRLNPYTESMSVVILSTSDDLHDVRAALRAGANSYIVKHADFRDFVRQIQVVCTYWLTIHKRCCR